VPAERLTKLGSLAFAEEGYAAAAAVEEKRSGGLFRRRR
jgi:hypothetical protein